jgi:hypothetical protein
MHIPLRTGKLGSQEAADDSVARKMDLYDEVI